MRVADFDFALDEELIAARPTEARDGARMMIVPEQAPLVHDHVRTFAEQVPAGALLIVNDTRVIPARLLGMRMSGGKVELLLVDKVADLPNNTVRWRTMGRASKQLRPGSRLTFGPQNEIEAEIHEKDGAMLEVSFWSDRPEPIGALLERAGEMPLPPYIARRRSGDESGDDDRTRYQTVFAKHPGAIAAPTAGLHLTEPMLARLRERGVQIASVTLHVGLGTFQPVTVDDFDLHPMHTERFEITPETASAFHATRARGAPVVAVGTTVVRALESAIDDDGHLLEGARTTNILIQPGHRFRAVDQLLTNFHLPKSTLLALVAAFTGHARMLECYAAAIAERYRFFSYGDCMYITHCASRA